MNISWDAEGYRRNFSFVPAYGGAVVDLVGARPGARCLDLGCGSGALTAELAERGLDVVGMDASPEMLDVARREHPDLCFIEGDATCFELAKPVDVVFSNAVLHWIDRADQPRALSCVARALAPGGEFVFEMGGHACSARVHEALAHAFARRDLAYEVPFFFPTVGEYAPLVEAAGMRVTYATLFDRPTAQVGPDGMANWIRMFVRHPFDGMDSAEAGGIVSEAVAELRPTMLRGGTWFVDYTRLRMRAVRI